MQVVVEQKDSWHLLGFDGHLDTNTAPDAEAKLNELIADGAEKLIIDFSALDYISSAGLRVLLATAKKLKAVGGTLRLYGLNPTVQEVFDISGFSTIFSIFNSEAEAMA